MATHLLDNVIKPNVTSGISNGASFNELLTVMSDSENLTAKELAEQIRFKLRAGAVNNENATCGGTNEPTGEPEPKKRKLNVKDFSGLKARYLNHLSTDNTDWPKWYVRFALIRKDQPVTTAEDLEQTTKLTLAGLIDELLFKKEPLDDLESIFHYKNKLCPRLILIIGGPGIGKSTLINEICVRWARGRFLSKDFDVVIIIPLRSVQQRSLENVIEEHVGKDSYERLKESAGARCLIILEGLDEIAFDRQQRDPFFVRLVKECTLFEEAKVLITSRPHACINLKPGRRIEIMGFGKAQIKEYVEKSLPESQDIDAFLQHLDDKVYLRSLCYVPMNLAMVIEIFLCNNKQFPSTMTELYETFVMMTLHRQIQRSCKDNKSMMSSAAMTSANREALCKILPGIPEDSVETVLLLSKLAYSGLFKWYSEIKAFFEYDDDEDDDDEGDEIGEANEVGLDEWKDPKIIFTLEDLDHCGMNGTNNFDGLGFLKASHVQQLPTGITTYSFTHLTVQEYFAALYIAMLPDQEQYRLMVEYVYDYSSSLVFPFICGITRLKCKETFQCVIDQASSVIQESFICLSIRAVKCLYESKCVQSTSTFSLDFRHHSVLPYECLCASFVLVNYPVSCLYLSFCNITDQGAEQLAKYFPAKKAACNLFFLELWDNDLTSTGFSSVIKIVKSSASDLSKALELNQTLQQLYIAENSIDDDRIKCIARTLCKSNIESLDISACEITFIGAVFLANALSVSKNIKTIILARNPIPVEGLRLIFWSAVNNTICKNVVYGVSCDEYSNDNEIQRMQKILESRCKKIDTSCRANIDNGCDPSAISVGYVVISLYIMVVLLQINILLL